MFTVKLRLWQDGYVIVIKLKYPQRTAGRGSTLKCVHSTNDFCYNRCNVCQHLICISECFPVNHLMINRTEEDDTTTAFCQMLKDVRLLRRYSVFCPLLHRASVLTVQSSLSSSGTLRYLKVCIVLTQSPVMVTGSLVHRQLPGFAGVVSELLHVAELQVVLEVHRVQGEQDWTTESENFLLCLRRPLP